MIAFTKVEFMKKSGMFSGLLFFVIVYCASLQAYDDQARCMLTPLAFLYHQHQSSSSFQSAFNPLQHAIHTNLIILVHL